MAITTKMTEVQNGMTFGYSDTCDTLFANGDWTASELARFSWCRWQDRYTNCLSATTIDTGSWQGAAVCNVLSYFQNNGGDLKTKYVDDLIPTQQPYAFNILMYGRDNDLCLNSSNASNYKVVTSCSDFQKLYVQVDEYKSSEYTRNVQHPTSRTIDVNRLNWSSGGVYNTDTNSYTSFITVWTVLVLDENTFFVTRGMAFPNREPCIYDGSFGSAQQNFRPSNSLNLDNTPTDDKWQYSSTQITTYDESKYLLRWYKNGLTGIEEDIWTAQDQYGCWDVDSDVSVIMHGSWGNYQYTYALRTENAVKNAIAYTGLRWKYRIGDTEHIYTPIIDGDGYITGWSTDPNVKTKLNDIIDVTGNNISPTPPGPGPGPSPEGDDIDDHIMGAGSQLSGIAQLWLLTRAQLIDLHAAFANAPVNYDPMSSFISVMGLGISALRVVGDSMPWTLNPINIKMSNGETWHTGVEGHIVDAQASAFNELNIRVQRKYNNFLDYSPYATHEIFLPMCGWITLPDIAVDRPIKVTYIPDIETLKVRAVVSVVDNSGNRCVVGEKDGVMGAEVPFTNIGHSLFLGNTVVQSADIAGEIVTGAIGAGFTKTNSKGGKFRPYEGFTVGMAGTLPGAIGNALVSGNINRTHFTTGNGSRIGFGDGENIQIKSTYHRIDKPSNYDHTVGKVCNKSGQLSSFHGFTVCDNPHIHISALDAEKEEIKRLLEEGVILPSGE